jgi:predicted cupin superfamily sugar epimerase
MNKEEIIKFFGLEKSSYDGGYFKRTFTSDIEVSDGSNFKIGSAIYYLITPDNFSRLHKCESDEIYHFYQGSPATLLIIDSNKNFKEVIR